MASTNNPLLSVAKIVLVRSVVVACLGAYALSEAVPTLMDLAQRPATAQLLVGASLISWAAIDAVYGARRLQPIDPSDVGHYPFGVAYRDQPLPSRLMANNESPNAVTGSAWSKWLASFWKPARDLPLPYKAALEGATAFVVGALGLVVGLIMLRVVLADVSDTERVQRAFGWLLGLGTVWMVALWNEVRYRGPSHIAAKVGAIRVRRVGTVMALAVVGIVAGTGLGARADLLPNPPPFGLLPWITFAGSALVLAVIAGGLRNRARDLSGSFDLERRDSVFRFTGDPADLVGAIRSYCQQWNHYLHGSWDARRDERPNMAAGEFTAVLQAELDTTPKGFTSPESDRRLQVAAVAVGIILTVVGAALLAMSSGSLDAMRILESASLVVFGGVVWRQALIPLSEVSWSSIIVECRISGTYEKSEGVHISRESTHERGSMLTKANAQIRVGKATSVSFLDMGLPDRPVLRYLVSVVSAPEPTDGLVSFVAERVGQQPSADAPSLPADVIEVT